MLCAVLRVMTRRGSVEYSVVLLCCMCFSPWNAMQIELSFSCIFLMVCSSATCMAPVLVVPELLKHTALETDSLVQIRIVQMQMMTRTLKTSMRMRCTTPPLQPPHARAPQRQPPPPPRPPQPPLPQTLQTPPPLHLQLNPRPPLRQRPLPLL